ncbi:MAG: YncE family protein [Gemmatimonadota bacterium]
MSGRRGRLVRTLAAVLILGLAACASAPGARGDPGPTGAAEGPEAASQEGPLLYVCNEGAASVTVIEMGTREVVTTVDLRELGFSTEAKPHHVVAEPDGSHWYVSLIGENRVLKLDRDHELVAQAEMETPGLMALDPASDRLYVGRSMKAVQPPQRIGVIRTADMSVEEREVFVPRPHAIAVQADPGWIHTASLATNQIASLPADDDGLELIELDEPVRTYVQFALSPDGRRMIATGQTSGELLDFDVTAPSSPELIRSLQLGGEPWHPSYDPGGRLVYVPRKTADAVDVVDVDAWEVAATIEDEAISQPHGSVLSPDGRFLFVSNNNLDGAWSPAGSEAAGEDPPGAVVVIDTRTREVVDVLTVGHNPTGLGTWARSPS